MNGINPTKRVMLWAPQGWLALLLLALCWPLNWTLPGVRTAYLFFPLWLGYIPFALELCALKDFLWPRSPALPLGTME
jgi:hypothetical protein